MNQKIYVNDDSQETEYTIIAKWNMNNNSYVAYTKGPGSSILVSKCLLENGYLELYDVTDEDEWQKVNNYLKIILSEDGGYHE